MNPCRQWQGLKIFISILQIVIAYLTINMAIAISKLRPQYLGRVQAPENLKWSVLPLIEYPAVT